MKITRSLSEIINQIAVLENTPHFTKRQWAMLGYLRSAATTSPQRDDRLAGFSITYANHDVIWHGLQDIKDWLSGQRDFPSEKIHLLDETNQVACLCHDVDPTRYATTDASEVTCGRCARTHAWRAAMNLPTATSPAQAALICRFGNAARFDIQPDNAFGPIAANSPITFALLIGLPMPHRIWKRAGTLDQRATVKKEARQWASEHGFTIS